jgi:hypothetical protein
MSYIPNSYTSQGTSFAGQPTKTYITTQAFNNELLTYTTSLNSNLVTVGTLTANPSATAALCPANEILHTNGKFLRPDVNPGVVKPLVGVYSPRTFLSGFIDPTDPTFAKYDVNFPSFYDVGISSPIATLGGQGANVRGLIDSAVGSYLLQGSANGAVNAGDAVTGAASIQPGSTYVTVNTSQCTASSRILLTKTAGGISTTGAPANVGLPAIPSVTNIAEGSFRITMPSAVLSGDQQIWQWFILK